MAAMLSLGWSGGCSTSNPPDATTQHAEAVGATTDVAHTIPPGTSMVFSVDERISTATHARGDVFSATLRHHVTDVGGGEAIPEGVPSQWIVAEASTKDGETVLAIRLESIRVNGTWTPVRGDVTEAHLRVAPDSSEPAQAEVAVGVAADALLDESGAATLAEAGTLVTLTMRGGSATLPAGSAITVQLTEPLEV
jgi:hypothetical protein